MGGGASGVGAAGFADGERSRDRVCDLRRQDHRREVDDLGVGSRGGHAELCSLVTSHGAGDDAIALIRTHASAACATDTWRRPASIAAAAHVAAIGLSLRRLEECKLQACLRDPRDA